MIQEYAMEVRAFEPPSENGTSITQYYKQREEWLCAERRVLIETLTVGGVPHCKVAASPKLAPRLVSIQERAIFNNPEHRSWLVRGFAETVAQLVKQDLKGQLRTS